MLHMKMSQICTWVIGGLALATVPVCAEDLPKQKKTSRYEQQKEFILSLLPQALSLQARKGIPASATVGMAIYESGWGQSALAREHHNLHGLKTGSAWNGEVVTMPTVDLGVRQYAEFRSFASPSDGIEGFGNFLSSPRYKQAFQVKSGPEFVGKVAAAGYCPDSDYSPNVKKIIEDRNLAILDTAAGGGGGGRRDQEQYWRRQQPRPGAGR
jgi:flagellum-specific peptidoglycan hydrolase FlgJ